MIEQIFIKSYMKYFFAPTVSKLAQFTHFSSINIPSKSELLIIRAKFLPLYCASIYKSSLLCMPVKYWYNHHKLKHSKSCLGSDTCRMTVGAADPTPVVWLLEQQTQRWKYVALINNPITLRPVLYKQWECYFDLFSLIPFVFKIVTLLLFPIFIHYETISPVNCWFLNIKNAAI